MSRVNKNKKSLKTKKLINFIIIGVILFWSLFWPSAYFTMVNINSNLKEDIKNSDIIPIKEKIKIIGENY